MHRFRRNLPLIAILIIGFGLRYINLDSSPPGYRDDTLINIYAISQRVLDGNPTLFFPEASGHEILYHGLAAYHVKLFGYTALGMRGLSVWLGVIGIALTYMMGRRLHSRQTGLIAAAALSLSFWSIMYSRFGLRHIQMPVFMLLAFAHFVIALSPKTKRRHFIYTAIFLTLGIYTYFAAYGMPLILAAYCGWLFLFKRPIIQKHWRDLLLMFGLTILLVIPLALTVINNPRGEDNGRVEEVGRPIAYAREGDFSVIWQHVGETLRMFHSFGDSEYLYNIPFRPVFGWPLAILFFAGLLITIWHALKAIRQPQTTLIHAPFMLIWLLAGISPAFLSVPSASLGHNIAVQPLAYILFALPFGFLWGWVKRPIFWLLPAIAVAGVGVRDLPDYFVEWPALAQTRVLYRADIRDAALYLNNDELTLNDFGMSSVLPGPWDRIAFETDARDSAEPRWFNPSRAILLQTADGPATNLTSYPDIPELYTGLYTESVGDTGSGYKQRQISQSVDVTNPLACFTNGLCLLSAEYNPPLLDVTWHLATPLQLPPIPIISHPPPPGVYDGPRLSIFAHLWDESSNRLTGDDGFWLDPESIQPGDVFRQQHILIPPDGSATTIAVGVYDPKTGERHITELGNDHIAIPIR